MKEKQHWSLEAMVNKAIAELPEHDKEAAAVRELISYGCTTRMHVARLVAPRIEGEDHTKDIDFTATGIRARRQAGYANAQKMLETAPWTQDADPLTGVVVHDVRPEA